MWRKMVQLAAMVLMGQAVAMEPCAAQESEAAISPRSSPIPLDNPGEWITSDDYPAKALKESRAGSVRFRLNVSAAGTVTDCTVIVSSGFADLDLATCGLIAKRALFSPARDRAGHPQLGVYTNRVAWVVPNKPPPLPSHVVTQYIVEADGTISHCEIVEVAGDAPDLPRLGKFDCLLHSFGDGYLDANGKSVTRKVTLTQTVTIADVPDPSPVP